MHSIGNDIIDLHHPSILEHTAQDEEWMHRHLTENEWRWLSSFSDNAQRFSLFWKIFAAKEASSKAITQLGHIVPFGSFTHFEVEIDRNSVIHCSGEVLWIQTIQSNPDWIHAVVCSSVGLKVVSEVHYVSDNTNASDYLMEKLLMNLKWNGYEHATWVQKMGIPIVVRDGKPVAHVSFSHSGRFAAFSWLLEKL
jgi:phosphopantetheine--protein transferase-like protein